MRRISYLFITTIIFLVFIGIHVAFADEAEQVKRVITSAYIDGIQNLGSIEAIKKGFHPGFTLIYQRDNQLQKLPIYNWIEGVKKRKAENPNGPKEKASAKFLEIDVSGNTAVARFEIFRGGKKIFTDAFFLLKFKEGWRIVSKISHRHL
jgi:hypothetical protein